MIEFLKKLRQGEKVKIEMEDKYSLKKKIAELEPGVYIVVDRMSGRILLQRQDGKRWLPIGVPAIYEEDIL